RSVRAPDGSPRISECLVPCTVTPGADVLALRCTTQPTTDVAGSPAAMAPSGSTLVSRRPSTGPPSPSQNHHGTPFMAGSTTVCGATSDQSRGASPVNNLAAPARENELGRRDA